MSALDPDDADDVAETILGDAQSLDGFERTTVPKKKSPFIGPYKLLQKIGQGGMGTVFMAEQTEPVRRRVALKLVRAGLEDKDVVSRFEAERQAIAMMDHPNIARILDAGEIDEGRPYFVMELVNGIRITEYCDKYTLSVDERLRLFIQACKAIQHAHQKGIIHRDVKPSNVLVTEHDGEPLVKVIDFGLAKALRGTQPLTDETMFTAFGQVVGTLQYMSPEQAELNSLDVDTRSDVYALGILLYELLTGSTPIEKQVLSTMPLDKALLAIREDEAPRPSTRLSSLGDSASSVSAQRRSDPRKLTLSMKGDLDWIAMKALEKDRSRRYETASEFAEDVKRFLDGEVVTARPPSYLYRLRKAANRHRTALLFSSAFLMLLIASLILTSWMAIRASDAEALAIAEAGKARAAEELAIAEAGKARAAEELAIAEAGKARAAEERVKDLSVKCVQWATNNIVKTAFESIEAAAEQKSDATQMQIASLTFQGVHKTNPSKNRFVFSPDDLTSDDSVETGPSAGPGWDELKVDMEAVSKDWADKMAEGLGRLSTVPSMTGD
jgi:serine/threonine protein kinase